MKRTISISQIEDRIRNSPKGTIFVTSDFKDLASSDAANKALLRLEKQDLFAESFSVFMNTPNIMNF